MLMQIGVDEVEAFYILFTNFIFIKYIVTLLAERHQFLQYAHHTCNMLYNVLHIAVDEVRFSTC